MLHLNEKEMETVADEFGITVEKLKEKMNEDNIAIFKTFDRFFYWMHEDVSTDDLIQLLADETNKTEQAEFCKLADGKTVFMYQ